MSWQLCPKCHGEGRVSPQFTSTTLFIQCDVCRGAKIISTITGLPPIYEIIGTPEEIKIFIQRPATIPPDKYGLFFVISEDGRKFTSWHHPDEEDDNWENQDYHYEEQPYFWLEESTLAEQIEPLLKEIEELKSYLNSIGHILPDTWKETPAK